MLIFLFLSGYSLIIGNQKITGKIKKTHFKTLEKLIYEMMKRNHSKPVPLS